MYDEQTNAAIEALRRMLIRGIIDVHDIRKIRVELELEHAQDEATYERGDVYHADGRCQCPVCSKPYNRHPESIAFPFLNRLCNGELVKL